MPQIRPLVPSSCLLAVGIGLLTACGKPAEPASEAPKARPAVVIPVAATMAVRTIERPARIEALALIELRPRVAGRIDAIHARDGQTVAAGTLLAEIDPRPYQAARAGAAARAAQAEAADQLARSELARAERLQRLEATAVSEGELDRLRSAVAQGEAAILAARAGLIQAELDLEWTRITAPAAGRLGRILIDAGNLVDRGQPVIAQLAADAEVEIAFAVDEVEAAHLASLVRSASVAVGVQLPGETGFARSATVSLVSPLADAGAASVGVRARLPNPGGVLRHGGSARVLVPLAAPHRVAAVPETAVLAQQAMRLVLVVPEVPPGATAGLMPRPVTLGQRLPGGWREASGVQPGELIIAHPVIPNVIPMPGFAVIPVPPQAGPEGGAAR